MKQGMLTSRAHYNGQAAESIKVGSLEELPFAQECSLHSVENQGPRPQVRPQVRREEDLEKGAADPYRQRHASVQEGEEMPRETVSRRLRMAPNPDAAIGTISDDHSGGLGPSLKGFYGYEEVTNHQRRTNYPANARPETDTESDDHSVGRHEDHNESVMGKKLVMERLARSREEAARFLKEASQPIKSSRWEPLAERDFADDELQWTPLDADQHIVTDQNGRLELNTASHTIYILGTGPTGKYIAHALASLSDAPPITLLMHTPLLMQQWHEEGANIQLLKNGKINSTSNFGVESSSHVRRQSPEQRFPGFGENLEHTAEPPNSVINCLIVTTEGHTTIAALSAIKHRLRRTSTICFIEDGLGVASRVDYLIFPKPEDRPSYMLGNMSHDLVATQRKFTLFEKQPGRTFLTVTPRNMTAHVSKSGFRSGDVLIKRIDYNWTPTSSYLMRTLSRAHGLGAVGLAETEFYEIQLQRLAVNSVIGPLSVMYDCFNDELLCNYQVSRSMKLLLKEISTILHRLPEVSRSSKKEQRFSAEKLESIIVGVLGKTGKNSTKMREAVRKGDRTDVDFFNGYLVQRAAELRIDCPHLEMMIAMVKGKQAMKSKEKNSLIPFKA